MRVLAYFKPAFLMACVVIAGCAVQSAERSVFTETGPDARIGEGPVVSFATTDPDGKPVAIGVSISAKALESMPATLSDGHHCFDHNGDGSISSDAECILTHERVVPLPTSVAKRSDIPFKWVLFNWNPRGHHPPGIYDAPHFDIHFMIEPIENIFAIRSGPCGPEFVNCDQFDRARVEVPGEYLAAGYQNVDAVVPAMGNHLIDLTSPELNGAPFTRTWMYGAYEGRITFYEEMVTAEYLRTRPDSCFAIKQPAAVEVAGYYPTQSCMRYDPSANAYTVSMESFVRRAAVPRATLSQGETTATDRAAPDHGGVVH